VHQTGGLMARVIQPAPKDRVDGQGLSLSQVS
jgi:hypothetical protein